MARTAVGAQLTEQHKTAQLRLRASLLQSFMRLWPIWTGDEATFRLMVDAAIPLVHQQHRASARLAAEYFAAFRYAEQPGGVARPMIPEVPTAARVAGSLYVVGRDMTRQAIAAGQAPQAARKTALVRTSGTVGTLALEGGRTTITQSVAADPRAAGWARSTSARCCAFCAMLASRGAVYGDGTATFRAHDYCACVAEPAYRDSALPPHSARYRELWDREAKHAGSDALQVFRQTLAAERGAAPQ